jgi:TDG/mug DNA glycosylase family protein
MRTRLRLSITTSYEANRHMSHSVPSVCFLPIADINTQVLVLGTLPGATSLQRGEYYATSSNQFWRLMEPVIGANLSGMDYQARLTTLLEAGVGVWDVMASAVRLGSLDSAIRSYSTNSLEALVGKLPSLRAFGFNGRKAFEIGRCQLHGTSDTKLISLPSSSAAYCAMSFASKRNAWLGLRPFLS